MSADLDDDGYLDLITANEDDCNLSVLINNEISGDYLNKTITVLFWEPD